MRMTILSNIITAIFLVDITIAKYFASNYNTAMAEEFIERCQNAIWRNVWYTNVESNSLLSLDGRWVTLALLREEMWRWRWFRSTVAKALTAEFCRHVNYVVKVDCFIDGTSNHVGSCGRFQCMVDMICRRLTTVNAPAASRAIKITTSSTWMSPNCHRLLTAAVWSLVLLVPVTFVISYVITLHDKVSVVWLSSGWRVHAATFERRGGERQTSRRQITTTQYTDHWPSTSWRLNTRRRW